MKRLSLMLCLAMLLSLLCPMGALGTEEIPAENTCDAHQAVCTNPGVCVNCGYEGEMETSHTGGEVYGQNDKTTHNLACAGCGAPLSSEEHCAPDCTSPCEKCGETKVLNPAEHVGGTAYRQNDEFTHFEVCAGCETVFICEDHCVPDCTSPCEKCGRIGVLNPAAHTGGTAYRPYDETTHYLVCTGCNVVLENENHYAYECTSPCEKCGYDGAFERSMHMGDVNSKCVANGDRHDYLCTACGRATESYPHSTTCKDPTHCQYCDYTGEITYVYHDAEEIVPNGATHLFRCNDCNEVMEEEPHVADCGKPNVCTICGYEGEIKDIDHGMTETRAFDEGHGEVCPDCSAVLNMSAHVGSCDQPNVCKVCGWEGEIAGVEHKWGYDFVDEKQHKKYCTVCSMVDGMAEHGADCYPMLNSPYCSDCGYQSSEMPVRHQEMCCVWSDETMHDVKCSGCYLKFDELPHVADCDKPTTCRDCGYEGEIEDVRHGTFCVRSIDENVHAEFCEACGEKRNEAEHYAVCDQPDVCSQCGYEGEMRTEHSEMGYVDRGDTHQWVCLYCSAVEDEGSHYAICTHPNVCARCGHEGEMEIEDHEELECTFTDEGHTMKCPACGETVFKEPHSAFCDTPNKCGYCDYEGEIERIEHSYGEYTHTDEKHISSCRYCGATEEERHRALCSAPNVCADCGYEGDISYMQHADGGYTDMGDVHIFECAVCGDSWDGEHWTFCGDSVCILCGSEKLSYTQHVWEEDEKNHNPETHELTCAKCGELFTSYSEYDIVDPTCTTDGHYTFTCAFCHESESKVLPALGHAWGEAAEVKATCEADGSSEKTCKTCGATEKTALPALGHAWGEAAEVKATCTADGSTEKTCKTCGATEKTVLPALGHAWSETARVKAACTADGSVTSECGRCGKQSVQKLGALGHDFGIVYASQNDGTHVVFCSRCNEKHAVKCAMASTEIGDMICSACPICGYTEYTMKESTLEALPGMDGVAVNVRLERVENVKFEPVRTADGQEAPATLEGLLLTVHRITLELQMELPDSVQARVREVLAVALLNGEESVQPEGMIRLSIPCEEERIEGLKLMLLTEEGELIEIEYEIIDGEIVFETDRIGVFLMVEDTAEEI